MGKPTVLMLRVVLALLLAGSLFVLGVMVPLLWQDIEPAAEFAAWQPRAVIAIVVLGIVASQVIVVCVWKLVTLVRRGSVFSHPSFRFVNVILGAVTAGGLLTLALAFVLAPGEAVAPGVVLLICGISLAIFGVALVVLVLRALLAQAVARDVEASRMKDELDEVI